MSFAGLRNKVSVGGKNSVGITQVIVCTDHPIAKILRKSDLAGRMIDWSVELSEFCLKYEPVGSIKGQHLAGFVVELQGSPDRPEQVWTLFVDGLSDKRNAGVGIVIKGPDDFSVDHSLVFKFKASNNQTEYEALIVDLRLVKDLGARKLRCNTDSQLVVGQVRGEYQMKDNLLLQYYHQVIEAMKDFEEVTLHQIPQVENVRPEKSGCYRKYLSRPTFKIDIREGKKAIKDHNQTDSSQTIGRKMCSYRPDDRLEKRNERAPKEERRGRRNQAEQAQTRTQIHNHRRRLIQEGIHRPALEMPIRGRSLLCYE